MTYIDIHMTNGNHPDVRGAEFDGFAVVRVDHDGAALKFYVDTMEQAQAIVDGFNRAFPKPLAEAAE